MRKISIEKVKEGEKMKIKVNEELVKNFIEFNKKENEIMNKVSELTSLEKYKLYYNYRNFDILKFNEIKKRLCTSKQNVNMLMATSFLFLIPLINVVLTGRIKILDEDQKKLFIWFFTGGSSTFIYGIFIFFRDMKLRKLYNKLIK